MDLKNLCHRKISLDKCLAINPADNVLIKLFMKLNNVKNRNTIFKAFTFH